MNGTKPKLVENLVIAYYRQPASYANAPFCHVNLLELSRYAKRCGGRNEEFLDLIFQYSSS